MNGQDPSAPPGKRAKAGAGPSASRQVRGSYSEEHNRLADAILLIGKVFHSVMTNPAEREELTLRQIEVIEIVEAHPAINISELADRLRLANSTVSELVQRLVESGHLERMQNPENRREVLVSLNVKGRDFLEQRHKNVLRSLEMMLGKLSGDKSERFGRALQTIAELAGEIMNGVHHVR